MVKIGVCFQRMCPGTHPGTRLAGGVSVMSFYLVTQFLKW